jgi:hypothetical protein
MLNVQTMIGGVAVDRMNGIRQAGTLDIQRCA